jgi:putative oxidoreductase
MNRNTRDLRTILQMALGFLMVTGGIMHFTIPAERWNLPLIDALKATGYMWEQIGIVIMIAGLALLLGRFVPLALIVLAPISLNILLIHLFNPGAGGIPIGLAIGGLQIAVPWLYWSEFRGLFVMNARSQPNQPEPVKIATRHANTGSSLEA